MENTMLNINYFATCNFMTLYWDKPVALPEGCLFGVYVNGVKVGESDKTHFTVRGLEAEKAYSVQVMLKLIDRREEPVSEKLTIITGKEKRKIDVTKAPYCVVGDGIRRNTEMLQQAIDNCDEESVVYFPAGVYLTGSLRLHSDMEVYLEEGAVLQGTSDPQDYLPKIHSRFEGYEMECYSSLLNLGQLDYDSDYNCRNVMIHGRGTIAGGGLALAKNILESEKIRLKCLLESLGDAIKEYENGDTIPGRARGRLINMSNCQNVIISGLNLQGGASWNVHMVYSDHIITHDCVISSERVWNGDGWDPDSSTNCTIFGTVFYTSDDSIAIKSGKNPEGNVINRPCEHIQIFDCIGRHGNGISIGSEMSGGVRDVKIWDCDMRNTTYGVEIKGTRKRGGYVKDVQVRDSKVSRILFHSVGYNDDGISAKEPPVFADCRFENLHILGEYPSKNEVRPCEALELIGFEQTGYEIQNVLFKDILLKRRVNESKQSLSLQHCRNIAFQNVNVE